MDWLLYIGIALTLIGLIGLGLVITRAWKARRDGLTGEAMEARLKGLLPLNLGALALSTLGLILVILGIYF